MVRTALSTWSSMPSSRRTVSEYVAKSSASAAAAAFSRAGVSCSIAATLRTSSARVAEFVVYSRFAAQV